MVEAAAREDPDRVQFIDIESGESTTIGELDKLTNQVAGFCDYMKLKEKDTAALMMTNSADLVAIWLGVAKVGASTALINTNNRGASLLHSLSTALESTESKIFIVDEALRAHVSDDVDAIVAMGIQVFYWNCNTKHSSQSNLKSTVLQLSTLKVNRRLSVKASDPLIFIYTSGTTGFPKACKMSYKKFVLSSRTFRTLCELGPSDRFYCATPMYHSSAGAIGVSAALVGKVCMVFRKKFSASNFTADCIKYRCTSMLYIGELCRYLVNTEPKANDKHLALKSAFGNGMRPEFWSAFQEKYRVKRIVEFYAATEGNAFLVNCFDKVGALGHLPFFVRPLHPTAIVRVDPTDMTKPLRDENGHCVRARPNEVGLLISRISNFASFEGYTDAKATNEKILRNVFKENDKFFNSGDLMYFDEHGYMYWSDRAGDTFRWKGENVSTSEVSSVLSKAPGVLDVNVYGVTVPGCDGKAGMALLSVDPIVFTTEHLAFHSSSALSASASTENGTEMLETTSTMKHLKGDRAKEGFDLEKVGGDQIHVYDARADSYSILNSETQQKIFSGELKL
eukprot:gene23037-31352_t